MTFKTGSKYFYAHCAPLEREFYRHIAPLERKTGKLSILHAEQIVRDA